MSQYHKQKTSYKDEGSLVAGLNAMGYETVEVHETAQNLVGYHGDLRAEKAHVIVRRKYIDRAANDLGFVKEKDGSFSAIVSAYDSTKHSTQWFIDLKKKYSEHLLMKTAAKQGCRLVQRKDANGKIQIRLMDPRVRA
jgi:hypothetical protein